MAMERSESGEGATLVERVMETVRESIASGRLAPGTRLASIRAQAARMGVSKSTVVEAYDRLAAEGAITSRRGSGFFVAGRLPPLSLAEIGPRLDREIDPFWVSRQSLEAGGRMLMPGCGWLPRDWMPEEGVRRALRGLARSPDANLADYGTPRGPGALRRLLAQRMAGRGLDVPPERIVLTGSGTEAIDLVCRFLLEPGDTVLVDDPCYFNFHAMLKAHRVAVVGVPYLATGPDLERFEACLRTQKPRLYITNSALHNPTGATLAPVVAHRVLKLAEAHDLTIVEDDIFADFEHEPAPRLAAFDGLERVIHIGSFSKTLSAAVRCGFIAARADWIEGLLDMKIATTFGGDPFSAELVLRLLTDGTYRKHVEELRGRLARAMGETARMLAPLGIVPAVEPRGGMFLWCRLPEGLDAADIARKALADNVVLAPGDVFSLSRSSSGFLRFNVAQSANPRIRDVLRRAMDAAG
ncbi:PLP-dependent aminotransferase family protein [Kaustia mangrovi]|uniref:PLP-dependent aminotransferase family protein n=1 Tax=Kaustia mangrovi TaxID=2593653 RepID=A0A7S8HAI7_9HYPH|nr:PLP-dependent aminotransferase family protein [Kaustia mangrovi]QPC41622.1 PLP-dependent aminotransferase family protein [Kaustia mangrovi]